MLTGLYKKKTVNLNKQFYNIILRTRNLTITQFCILRSNYYYYYFTSTIMILKSFIFNSYYVLLLIGHRRHLRDASLSAHKAFD